MTRKKITSIQGKRIAKVTSDANYFTLRLETNSGRSAGRLTVRVDNLFDQDGNLLEDNLPYVRER